MNSKNLILLLPLVISNIAAAPFLVARALPIFRQGLGKGVGREPVPQARTEIPNAPPPPPGFASLFEKNGSKASIPPAPPMPNSNSKAKKSKGSPSQVSQSSASQVPNVPNQSSSQAAAPLHNSLLQELKKKKRERKSRRGAPKISEPKRKLEQSRKPPSELELKLQERKVRAEQQHQQPQQQQQQQHQNHKQQQQKQQQPQQQQQHQQPQPQQQQQQTQTAASTTPPQQQQNQQQQENLATFSSPSAAPQSLQPVHNQNGSGSNLDSVNKLQNSSDNAGNLSHPPHNGGIGSNAMHNSHPHVNNRRKSSNTPRRLESADQGSRKQNGSVEGRPIDRVQEELLQGLSKIRDNPTASAPLSDSTASQRQQARDRQRTDSISDNAQRRSGSNEMQQQPDRMSASGTDERGQPQNTQDLANRHAHGQARHQLGHQGAHPATSQPLQNPHQGSGERETEPIDVASLERVSAKPGSKQDMPIARAFRPHANAVLLKIISDVLSSNPILYFQRMRKALDENSKKTEMKFKAILAAFPRDQVEKEMSPIVQELEALNKPAIQGSN